METSCAFSSKRAWHCLLGVVASQAKRSPGPASDFGMTDWILRGGEVVDGSGRPRRRADVAIAGDRIAAVGVVGKVAGAREIDVTGRIVAPGFIDVHTHDDRALLATPDMAAKASQGVTTVVTGNCGVSLAPLVLEGAPPPPLDLIGDAANYHYERFADYLAALDRTPAALNAACLVGHSTLRVGAMSGLDRPAEQAELARMGGRLQEALDAGAVGLSTGLAYAPAFHAPAAEIEALAALLRPAGALYTTHMRNEAGAVVDSLDESFAAGRARLKGPRYLVEDRPRAGRPRACRNRHRLGRQPEGGGRSAAAGGCGLLDDGRGRCATSAAIRAHDDRFGRAAARHAPASAAVGRLPARPRLLQPRARPLQPRRGGAPDDRPFRLPLRSRRQRHPRGRRLRRRYRLRC